MCNSPSRRLVPILDEEAFYATRRAVRLDADMTAPIASICGYEDDGQQACLPAGRGRCSLRALARRLNPAAFRKLC